jgi:tetratricopeptide (TPR) repeat protein
MDRRSTRPHLALARYWQRQGAVRGAVVALRRHALRRPSLAPKLQLARLYLRAQLPTQALALVESLPVAEPQVRLVLAEVLAAQDCARATPLLGALDPRSFPSALLLLRGRCALQHGNAEGAQEMARSYLALATQGREAAALGHGLLGDAYAAQGNLAEARRRYLSAGVSDPAARLWQIRLAGLHAREGDPATAIAELRRIGPPSPSSLDVEWWLALGAALLQHKERDSLRRFLDELTPQVARAAADPADAELFAPAPPRMVDARAWALQGQLALALGEPETAVAHLEESLRLRATSGVRRLLVDALTEWSAQLLAEDRFRPHHRGAGAVGASPSARGHRARSTGGGRVAAQPRDRVALAGASTRGRGGAGARVAARTAPERDHRDAARPGAGRRRRGGGCAQPARVRGEGRVGQRGQGGGDRASQPGDLDRSRAGRCACSGRWSRRPRTATWRGATRRRGPARSTWQRWPGCATGDAEGARALLEELARTSTDVTLRCNHALATVAARGRGAAAVIRDLGVATCPFAGGSDGLAILSAAVDGQIPGSADRALAELTAVARRSPQSKALVAAATRMVALAAADHAYRRGTARGGAALSGRGAARAHRRRRRRARAQPAGASAGGGRWPAISSGFSAWSRSWPGWRRGSPRRSSTWAWPTIGWACRSARWRPGVACAGCASRRWRSGSAPRLCWKGARESRASPPSAARLAAPGDRVLDRARDAVVRAQRGQS